MNDNELIRFTKSLIKCPSFDLESKLPQLLTQQLQKFKIKYSIFESNGVQNIVACTSSKTNIVFNAHWDTIRPSKFMKEENISDKTHIYGLGACDMKSGASAMLAAFIDCYMARIPGIALCLVGDEELGGRNGTKVLTDKGIVGKYVVLGEPTGLQISLGQKGGIRCVLQSRGVAAHGAYPQRGVNAILKLTKLINRILKRFPLPQHNISPGSLFSKITVSVNTITGGSSENVVADSATATLDIRIPPKIAIEKVINTLNKMAEEEKVETEFIVLGEGWNLKRTSHFTKIATTIISQITKKKPKYIYKMGTNDGKYYKGCEILNIGPGDNTLSHTVREKTSVEEIVHARRFYFELAKNLSNRNIDA